MKTVQKLEVIAGCGSLVAVLMFIYFVDITLSQKIAEARRELPVYDWKSALLFLILPALLIAVSSYFHAYKHSTISLIVILLLGGVITFLYAVGFLIGSDFQGNIVIGILPGLMTFFTIVLAVINNLWFSKADEN
jgi:uncharacterized membrane protein YfcA